jgi:arginyl-tRNA--protein-N-Asp/Glu arginylyltransferase
VRPTRVINEYFMADRVEPFEMDSLWAEGWRHFGPYFFRYSFSAHDSSLCHVLPLRIRLDQFSPSRSQRRILKKNEDLRVVIRDATLDPEKQGLFERHRRRFKENVPDSIYDFMSPQPASVPCLDQEICAYRDDDLLAMSFLDIGEFATSAVYAAFEPVESKRSLGIFTMLCAIAHSQSLGCEYYYPGYAYVEPSTYDYKKRFSGLEYFDWDAGWRNHPAALRPV